MAEKDFRVKLGLHVGANAYVEGSITNVDQIQMNIASPTAVSGAGQFAWNIDEGTVDLAVNANTTLQLGQETHMYVKNVSGTIIPDGTVVMANGTNGASGRIHVAPAIMNGTFPSKYLVGIATEDIPDGGDGYVTVFGKVRGLDTSMFNEGDILYADPAVAGGLSNTAPIAPNNIVTVAIVVSSHAEVGTLFVRPTYGSSLYTDESVLLDNVQDGETLVYVSANSRFENQTVSGGGGTSSNSFATIAVSGQSNVIANTGTDVLTFVAGSNMTITTNAETDTITFASTGGSGDVSNAWVNANDAATLLSAYANDAALYDSVKTFNVFSVAGQANVVAQSFGSQLTFVAGPNVTIATNATANSITIDSVGSGEGGTSSNSFATIAVSGQSNVVANTSTDVLTFVAGDNITITTNAETDTITFASAGGGGGDGTDEFARTIAFLGL